jgi:hypothetical protein
MSSRNKRKRSANQSSNGSADRPDITQWIEELNPEALTADGFEEAIIGVAERCGCPSLVVYDAERCIDILVARDGMERDEALDFFYCNTLGSYVGPHTPLFLWKPPAQSG